MSHNREKRAVVFLFCAAMFACASFLAARQAAAQQSRPERSPSPMERLRERQLRREAQMETGIMIEALKREASKPVEERRAQSANFQLKHDFEQLQTIHNRMMTMTFSNNVLDYKLISEALTEIKKRASRLKSNLPLPAPAEDKREAKSLKGWGEIDRGQLKPALLALDDLIMSFVTNPVFRKAEVIDIHQSSRARRDLEDIIKLSEKIKKSADALTKDHK
jgi:hypothetical protein